MLFRYKITKSYDSMGNIHLVHYNVIIQWYNQNNMLFKWRTCANTTLKSIAEILVYEYCFSGFDNGLQEIAKTIDKYGSVDKMVDEYIRRIVIRDMRLENDMDNIEKSIDNLVLTDGWNTIEIKENK